jgi:hypothetical protein
VANSAALRAAGTVKIPPRRNANTTLGVRPASMYATPGRIKIPLPIIDPMEIAIVAGRPRLLSSCSSDIQVLLTAQGV